MSEPLDDFRDLFSGLPPLDEGMAEVARLALWQAGASGRMVELAAWVAAVTAKAPEAPRRPQVVVFAGTHGVARVGLSSEPPGATAQAVERIAAGATPLAQACVAADHGLKVFDLALDLPTADISREPALAGRDCAATMAYGMEATAGGTDLLCLTGIGAGGGFASSAILATLFGGEASGWLESARSSDQAVAALSRTVALHGGQGDALEVLRRCGGREHAAIAGAILAARAGGIPVILDGAAAVAGAAVLHMLDASAIGHCRLAQPPAHEGAARAAERIGLKPLFEARIADDAGTGAALAAGVVKTAATVAAGLRPARPG